MRATKLPLGSWSLAFTLALCACLQSERDNGSARSRTVSEDDGEGGRSGGGDCDAPHEVEICHRPPGNPDNAHTLCVSENAVDAHVANHGDTLGPCDDRGDGGAGGAAETGAGGGEDNRCYDDMPACRTDEDCAELCVEAICLDRCCILPSY